jgi:hypothetical protein
MAESPKANALIERVALIWSYWLLVYRNLNSMKVRSSAMKEKYICSTFMLCVFLFLVACSTSLNQYNSRSVEEETVIKVVMEHERTWNEHDAFGFLATYHDSAQIELGCKGQLLPQKEFATKLPQLMNDYPTVELVNPTVDVSGKEGVVKVTSTRLGDENHIFRIEMLKENERWYIIQESCY